MKLVLLGTAGYHPCDARQTACFLLPEIGVMFDAGTAVYRLTDYMSPGRLNIFVTHAHLDHIIGLTYLFGALPSAKLGDVAVHGEAAKLDAIREKLFAELLFPVPAPFRFCPLTGPVELSGGARLTYFPLDHPGGAVGYRLDLPDRSMAYVSDTVASLDGDYIDCIRGVDLLLHEAYFVAANQNMIRRMGHSRVRDAAEVAAKAEVGRLILVHLSPMLKDDNQINLGAAKRIFPATEIGVDRMEVEF